jgi:hypothetical protein
VVAGGVTIWSGIDTVNNPGADAVKQGCVGQDESCALYQEGIGKQNRTNILIGVTAGLAAVTVVIGAFATNWGGGKAAPARQDTARRLGPSFDVAPWASIQGGGLQAFGRF